MSYYWSRFTFPPCFLVGLLSAVLANYAHCEVITEWMQGAGYASTNIHSLAIASVCDSQGNIIVNGHRNATGAGSAILVIKYSGTNGQILWTNEYVGPAQVDGLLDDFAPASGLDQADNVFIAGYSINAVAETGSAAYLAKYAGDTGNLLWQKRYYYASTNSSSPHKLVVDDRGDLFVLGWTGFDIFVVKCSGLDGGVLWERLHNGPMDQRDAPRDLRLAPDGNIIILAHSPDASFTPCYIVKLNSADGGVMWEQRSAADPSSLAVDAQGNAFVGGKGRDYPPASFNLSVTKYAATDGALLWERLIDSPSMQEEDGGPIAVDGQGNVVMSGLSVSELFTVKLAGVDGALLWQELGPTVHASYLHLTLDSQNNVMVAGNHHNGSNLDMVILKYAAADGNLLWEKRFSGNGEWDDVVFSLVVRRDNSFAVSGFTDKMPGPGIWQDFLTIVYTEAPNNLRLKLLAKGAQLHFSGLPNRVYFIQRSASFAGPWVTLGTRSTDEKGALEYLDVWLPAEAAFYRVVVAE